MMIRRFLMVALCAMLVACGGGGSDKTPLNDACSDIGLSTKVLKIVNGTSCGDLASSPVVRVFLLDAGGGIAGFCSGSMIASNAVLTAGHCLAVEPAAVSIVYGEAETALAALVEQVHVHPDYQRVENSQTQAVFNDVAVMVLDRNLSLPTLPLARSVAPFAGQILSVFGYGTDENGDFDGNLLRSGQMSVTGVTPNHISALYDGTGSNTCTGDSGGPLVMTIAGQPAIIGVTSSGSRTDCLAGDNSLFTNLQSQEVFSFIQQVVPSIGTL